MGIGPSNTKGTYPCAARRPIGLPLREFGIYKERAVFKIYIGVGFFEMEARRNFLVLERKDGLD